MSDVKGDDASQNEELSIRLSLAGGWISLWRKAYDALLHHGVNVRTTKEFKDTALLDAALEAKDIREGQVSILEYLKRVESGLNAAVRRKALFKVTD